ncbi:MAG: tetratricopeptide repeat protein, partial [Moraxellaceae bacterium]
MFRRYVFLLFFASQLPTPASSQHRQKDSLFQLLRSRTVVGIPKADTATVNLLNNISAMYVQQVSDSAFLFADQALRTATRLNYPAGRAAAYANIAKMHYQKGNYLKSLKNALSALELSNKANDRTGQADASNLLGLIHLAQNNVQPALREFKRAETLNQILNDRHRVAANYFNQGLCYLQNKQMDSAVYYLLKSKDVSKIIDDRHMLAMSNNRLGDYYAQSGQTDQAIAFYKAVSDNEAYRNDWENSFAYTGMAECYLKKKAYNQAVKYGEQGLMLARKTGTKWDIERALKVLYESSHALGRLSQAYDFLLMEKLYHDSLFNNNKEKEINGLYLRQKQAENEVLIKKNQLISQENRASTGSCPVKAKSATTSTAVIVWTTEPTCGLWNTGWVTPSA